jgi:hypothetical protein
VLDRESLGMARERGDLRPERRAERRERADHQEEGPDRQQARGHIVAAAQLAREPGVQRMDQERDEQRPADRREERRQHEIKQVTHEQQHDERKGAGIEDAVRGLHGPRILVSYVLVGGVG